MMQTQKVPPVFETNVDINTTIVADQEAFFADATTHTHPPIGGFRLSIAVPEDTPPGSHIASVDANHFNHDPLSYSLSGAGSAPFRIAEADVGDIVLDSALDHETDASHDITVTVTDSDGMTDTMTVTVTVTDSDDTGTLALSPTQPQVGVALRATVNDPDGGAEHAVWTWERSQAQDDWLLISEATGSVYLPKSADLGYRLRVTVAYSDAYGTGKQLQAVSARTAESAVVYPTGNRLSTAARDLLVDYLPSGVLVMGGTSAISEATLAAARQASESDSVRRILGATRAETAAAVASRILEGSSDGDTTVVVVNG